MVGSPDSWPVSCITRRPLCAHYFRAMMARSSDRSLFGLIGDRRDDIDLGVGIFWECRRSAGVSPK